MPRKVQPTPASSEQEWKSILPRGYLSPSSIQSYLMCPKAWEYDYLHKQERTSSPAADEGKAFHAAVEFIHRKMEQGEDWDLTEVLDGPWTKAVTDYASQAGFSPEDMDAYFSEAGLPEMRERATEFIQQWDRYYLKGKPFSSIHTVEEAVEGEIGGIPTRGFIDLTYWFKHPEVKKRSIKRIVDFKVVKRAKSEKDALNSIQLGIYSILTGVRNVGFVSCSKTTGKVTTQFVTLEDSHLRRVKGVVRSVAEAIKKRSFPYCDPSHWKCSPMFCDAFEVCPQGGGDE